MPDDFLIAANPDPDSSLPYLVRLPLGPAGVVLKVRDTWPRTAKVYCHRADGCPQGAEVLERVPVRACTRRGAAIDLVLDRGRENRSQFVFTVARGREMLDIVVDSHERDAWSFSEQQATIQRAGLVAGDVGRARAQAG